MHAGKFATRALIAAASIAAALGTSATAHADLGMFQSPTGDVFCLLGVDDAGNGNAVCQGDGPTALPKPADCHLAWGDLFSLAAGGEPMSHCHGDTIVPSYEGPGIDPSVPILEYGQASSAGTITCRSEPSSMTCTDSTTGRYFRMSAQSNEVG